MKRFAFRTTRLVAGLILTWAVAGQAFSQTTTADASMAAAQAKTPATVPLNHLYWHLLIYQHQLDQLADEHEKQGKDGRWLRSYLQTKLFMTATEFQPIRESADELSASIATLDAKAASFIAATHQVASSTGGGTGSSPTGMDHSRHELKALTKQREALIDAQVKRLNDTLSPSAQATLQRYLENTFAKNVVPLKVDAKGVSTPPFDGGAREGGVKP